MRPTPQDELFVHQLPELLPAVAAPHPHWRESYFFELHDPLAGADGDVVFLTYATHPSLGHHDAIQMGRVGGEQRLGVHMREHGTEPVTTSMPGAVVEVLEPWRTVRILAEEGQSGIGADVVFTARSAPYALRRGTMWAGADDLVWDQSHVLQSGTYTGTITAGGVTRDVAGWVGQRDHSWGVRDHGRCPLWLWFQVQLEDGMLGVWHWELENGTHVYTDGCWAPFDGSEPVPLMRFEPDVDWVGSPAVTGLSGRSTWTFADGSTVVLDAEGTFARPYEPYHRGGLNLMTVRTHDGRSGTAIYEVTGARHHRWFPDAEVPGPLPT